jgi:3-oxoacid CoA-transferase A subunit
MADSNQESLDDGIQGKVYPSAAAALEDITDGASLLISGFAGVGSPEGLLRALRAKGISNLTCICQGAWRHVSERLDVAELVANGQVRKLISPMGFYPGDGGLVEERWKSGDLEIEVVPPGVLAERLRAGGAGLAGIFLPGGIGTRFEEGKEVRTFGHRDHIFESALRADFALLRAEAADTLGNLIYRGSQRNWNPVMAMAGRVCIVEVDQIHEPGGLDPEVVITPGIYIDRVVQTV